MASHYSIAWDIGGAHVKLAVLKPSGQLMLTKQYPCPLWRGMRMLTQTLSDAIAMLKQQRCFVGMHAVTMSGEMADCFATRQEGVQEILRQCRQYLPKHTWVYAMKAGWLTLSAASEQAQDVASLNWHASATCCAMHVRRGILIDIGSTSSDIIPFDKGQVLPNWATGYADAQRLADATLVYTGVMRTPVMAMAQSIVLDGQEFQLLAEYFADSADVYRILGTLPADAKATSNCDGMPLDYKHSLRRFARMFWHGAGHR